jgi:hypothetical protein
VAMRSDLALSSSSEERHEIVSRFKTIGTRAQASVYMQEVGKKVQAARNAYRRSRKCHPSQSPWKPRAP